MHNANLLITQRLEELSRQSKDDGANGARSLTTMTGAQSTGNLKDSHFERLWQRMAETYGHKWTSSYGHEPNQSWRDGLADMTVDDIRRGLGALRAFQDGEGWPPTLLQFRELCKPISAPAHEVYKAIPAPKSPLETRKRIADECIASLRESSLKTDENSRSNALTDEGRALMRILDGTATPEDHETAASLLKKIDSCTCKMLQSGDGYQVSGVKCPECTRLDKFEIFKGF